MPPIPLETPVAVIGCGAMGTGIAQVAAAAGHRVLLFDSRERAAPLAIVTISEATAKLVQKNRMQASAREQLLARLTPVNGLEDLANAGIAIEAIVEDLDTKRAVFKELARCVGRTAILASNTSSLSITALAAGIEHPERLCGMHFFNPAPLMPLVEVVSGLETSPTVARTVFDTAASWGKTPVMVRSTPGFIVNRVARPFYAEALRVLQEGAGDPATLDAIMREAGGFRMGPFELMDLIGHDVNFAVTRSVHAAFYGDPRFSPSVVQQELVEAGWLGRKSGRGFFHYSPGSTRVAPSIVSPCSPPKTILACGDLGPAKALIDLFERAGRTTERAEATGGDGYFLLDSKTRLALSDGRSATERAAESQWPELVLFDLALDFISTPRIAVAAAENSTPAALAAACGFFQSLGKSVSVLKDIPGLIVLRTVAMLANEAAEAVLQGVAAPEAIDTAMCKGTSYPLGPLAWADQLGPRFILRVLESLMNAYGEDRYRPSSLLRRTVARNGRLSGDDEIAASHSSP
jgi:3-hydroxybutyryl-CoA dehydrogenase